MKKEIILKLFQSVFSGIGLLWLFIEAHNALDNNAWNIDFLLFLLVGAIIGIIWFIVNGLFVEGFLKRSICVESNALQSKIKVFYGDLFKQDGYKAIAVNEYFDSIVDDKHVSAKSLHGILLKKYWSGNVKDWDGQVENELDNVSCIETVQRSTGGKQKKYEIGTAVNVTTGTDKFICVALAKTNINNLEAFTSSEDFQKALRGLLKKARSVCAGESFNIPLLGSGLSRTGIKINILIDLILLAIFEESKNKKITDEINIVLPKNKKKEICLLTIEQDWR